MIALAAPSDRGRHGQLDAGGVVLVEERHHVAAADPQRPQGAGEPAYPVVPLRPGPGAAEVGERLTVGVRLGPVGEPVVEEGGVGELGGTRSSGLLGPRGGALSVTQATTSGNGPGSLDRGSVD